MAELSEIQVGGKLRLELPITNVDRHSAEAVQVDVDHSRLWLSRDAAKAAEYIPPPRTFKRGDLVRHPQLGRNGIVVAVDRLARNHDPLAAAVHFRSRGVVAVRICDLEPDEAPE